MHRYFNFSPFTPIRQKSCWFIFPKITTIATKMIEYNKLKVPGSTPPETVKNIAPLIPPKKLDSAKAEDLYLKIFIPIASAAMSPSLIAE